MDLTPLFHSLIGYRKLKRLVMQSEARFFLFLLFLSLLICLAYTPVWYSVGNLYQVWNNALCSIGYLLAGYLIIKKYPTSLFLGVFISVGIVNVTSVALTNYQASAAFLVWMLIQPISSFYFFPRRAAILQCITTLCLLALIPVLSPYLPQTIFWSESGLRLTIFSGFLCVFSYIALMGYYYSFSINQKSRALERKNKHLTRTQDKLLEQEQLKNKFIADMNHELRTPLNAILGITRIIQSQNTPLAAQDEWVQQLKRSSEHLLQIINEVLDLSKINSKTMALHRRAFSMQELIHAAKAIIQPLADNKQLIFEVHADHCLDKEYLGDQSRLLQILINLLNNAVKFTHQGRVELRIRSLDEATENIEFSVSDTGIGIPAHHMGRIFDEFHQGAAGTHLEFGGSGLGLHISKRFVELMQGSITCNSEVGKGSTFTFSIPLPQASKDSTTADTNTNQNLQEVLLMRFPRVRILIVDDNQINLIVSKKLIETHLDSYQVDTVEDPSQIRTMMRKQEYDILLLDINVPGHNMLEVAASLKQHYPHSKLIAHTADSTFSQRTDLAAGVFDEILIKPFHLDALYLKLYRLLSASDAP